MTTLNTSNFKIFVYFCGVLKKEIGSKSSRKLAKIEQVQSKIPRFSTLDYFQFNGAQLEQICEVCKSLQKLPFAQEASAKAREELDRRLKIKIISDFEKGYDLDHLFDLFQTKPYLFEDREFLLKVVEFLADLEPVALFEKFLNVLPHFDREQAIFIGSRFEDTAHRSLWVDIFGMGLGFTRDDLECRRQSYLNFHKKIEQATLAAGGICNGATFIVASEELGPSTDRIWRKGRFIQSAYLVTRRLPEKKPLELGQEIFKRPDDFPYILRNTASLLNFRDTEALLRAFRAGDRTIELATFVGKYAQKMVADLPSMKVEVEELNATTEMFRIAARDGNKTIDEAEAEFTSLLINRDAAQGTEEIQAIEEHIAQYERYKQQVKNWHKEIGEAFRTYMADAFHLQGRIDSASADAERLEDVLEGIEAVPMTLEEIPEPILERLKVRDEEPFVEARPFEELGLHLFPLKNKTGTYFIVFSTGKGEAHVILFCNPEIGPSYFYDINDFDPLTYMPNKRIFLNKDKMFDSLLRYCNLEYPGQYATFSISRCSTPPSRIPRLKPGASGKTAPKPKIAQTLPPSKIPVRRLLKSSL